MTTYERLVKKGKIRGLEKGIKKGVEIGEHNRIVRSILKNRLKFSIFFLSDFLDVSEDFVKEVIDGKVTKIKSKELVKSMLD